MIPINNNSGESLITKLQGKSELLSSQQGQQSNSAFLADFNSALEELSNLDNSDVLRETAIENGKQIIKNWNPPTDKQIDFILSGIKKSIVAG